MWQAAFQQEVVVRAGANGEWDATLAVEEVRPGLAFVATSACLARLHALLMAQDSL